MEMPEIEWPEWYPAKPSNKEFLQYKESCINDVLSRLQMYVDTLCTLQGFRNREDVREVAWFCLREFVAHFWDLPASRDFHHNGRWGLLCHSLDVAFRRAVSASQHIAIDKQGKPSAEAAWKNRTESVLVAWITGLFHDCGKIFDVRVIYKPYRFEPARSDQGTSIYHPLMGGLLGFKLKHTEKYLVYEWAKNRGMRHVRLNPGMFVILMQQVAVRIMQNLDHEQIIDLFEALIADGDEADAESVADYRKEEDQNHIGKALQFLASDGFKAKDGRGSNQVRVFYLGHNTYVFIHPLVVQSLAKYIKNDLKNESYDKDAVLNYLINSRYIYCSEGESSSGKYFTKETFYINESKASSYISFVHGNLFSNVNVNGIPMIKLENDEGTFERIKEILGSEPPISWFHKYDAKESDKQEELISERSSHLGKSSKYTENVEDVKTDFDNSLVRDDSEDRESAEVSQVSKESPKETEGEEKEQEDDSADSGETRPESSEDSEKELNAGAGVGDTQEEGRYQAGEEGQEADRSPARKALWNLFSGLKSGEFVVDDPENEKNIGYVSVLDGHFWAIHSSTIKKIFKETNVENVKHGLQELSELGIVRMNGNKYLTNESTLFHHKGMEYSLQGKYAVLDRAMLIREVPELEYYL